MPVPKDKTDRKSKLGDFVEVLVPLGTDEQGNARFEKGIVQRAGLSDEQWAQVKKQAEEAGRMSMTKESGDSPDAGARQEQLQATKRLGDVITFKDPTGATTVVPRGDMPDNEWQKRLLEARKRDTFVSGSYNGEAFDKQPVLTSEVGSQLGGEGQKVEAEFQKGGARPGSPEAFFSRSVVNALPGPEGMGTPPGPIPAGQGSLLDALPEPKGQEIPAPIPAPDFATAAGTSQALGGPIAASPGDALKKVGSEMLGPAPGAQMTDLVQAGKDSFAQPQTPAPMQAPAPGPQPTSMGMNVKVAGGPGMKPAATPGLGDIEKQFTEGVNKEAAAQGEAANQRIIERANYEKNLQALEAEQKKAQLRQREAEDRINNAYLKTLDEMTAKAQIDPDHFWNTRSDGAKVGMLLSGFLAGLGGRDPSSTVERMVAQDIAVQRENFNLQREAGKAKLAGLDTVYGRLRQRGLDDAEAASAARASMKAGLAMRMDDVADRLTDPVAKAKAQQVAAQFRLGIKKDEDALRTSAQQRTHWQNQDGFARLELGMKAQAAEDKKKGDKKTLQATLSKELQGLQDARSRVLQLKEASKGGLLARGAVDAASSLPLGSVVAPGAAGKQNTWAIGRAEILKSLFGSVTESDYELAEGVLPKKIEAGVDPTGALDQQLAFIDQQIARREAAYNEAGPDVRGESAGGQGGR
jgi:hypothetical protein